jgi:hypothetical protein
MSRKNEKKKAPDLGEKVIAKSHPAYLIKNEECKVENGETIVLVEWEDCKGKRDWVKEGDILMLGEKRLLRKRVSPVPRVFPPTKRGRRSDSRHLPNPVMNPEDDNASKSPSMGSVKHDQISSEKEKSGHPSGTVAGVHDHRSSQLLTPDSSRPSEIGTHPIGTKVRKCFGDEFGWYDGKIVSFSEDFLYKVLYQDGYLEEYSVTGEIDDLVENSNNGDETSPPPTQGESLRDDEEEGGDLERWQPLVNFGLMFDFLMRNEKKQMVQ